MSVTAFPVNDLLRRKLQTTLTIISLTTSVASTLFLLLFSGQIGFGIAAQAQNTLTKGTSIVFSQFLTFVGALIFAVGAVIVSFIVFLMMAQRTRDYGLMKATGCPNGLVFGYFFTELLGVTFISCVLGVALGFAVDFGVINLSVFEAYNKAPNFWFAPLVFVAYFIFALVFGAKPMLNAARMQPIKSLSQVQYYGLAKGAAFKPLSRTALTIRIATRSLFRRKSATVRIVLFLSLVFLLLTVSIAGGVIASDTSESWLQKAVGENVLLVAKPAMTEQYVQLLLAFSGAQAQADFNYSDPNLGLPDTLIQHLAQTSGVAAVDERLIWQTIIQEIPGYMIDPETLATIPIGDNRQGTSLIVGLDGGDLATKPFTTGTFLNATSATAAVVADSVAHTVYASRGLGLSDPLRESVRIHNVTFKITGICVDPLNGGLVTYVPLSDLKTMTALSQPNVVLVKVDPTADYAAVKTQILTQITDAGLSVIELNAVLERNTAFLSSLWQVIMVLPAFALAAATLCLIGFQRLTIDEQHQEFAVLRATGAKPRTIMAVLSAQSATVLLSSFGVGISLGTILCILILTASPVVSATTILTIAGWLLASLLGMFLLSLYPAAKFAKRPLLEIMS